MSSAVAVVSSVTTAAGIGGTVAGFTSSGIAGGSIAAVIQAGIGDVVAGSAFASLQSFGALGGFVGMICMGVFGLLFSFFFG